MTEAIPHVLLLAAGQSRRFGSDKTLYPWRDGIPLALVTAHNILQAGLPLSVILRAEQHALAALLTRLPLSIILASEAHTGLSASLAAGVRATSSANGWLIALADMPQIQSSTYRDTFKRLAEGAATTIVAPHYQGQRGHPVGFGPAWREALMQQHGDQGARALFIHHAEHLCLFATEDASVLYDIDTQADLIPLANLN